MLRHAYLAGGCFWCITPVFYELGAEKVKAGYAGGNEENPAYADVKAQKTGHRETIDIIYDDSRLSYAAILDTFLSAIDPFDDGGQFIDRGHSYTAAIYYTADEEKQIAEAALSALKAQSGQTPCVALEPYRNFYDAEEYHQDYFRKEPEKFEQELIESGRKKAPADV